MSHIRSNRSSRPRSAAGFTLIEMLVSVTLVLIMMTLFAQIFQMAGSSISKQRGLAENDQRSRTLQTILKADLDKRTYRWVYPFAANEDVSAPESYIGKRQGFLYISENNPNSKIDDVLHLTIAATVTARNKDTSPYYGKALNLTGFNTLNEPDADDAHALINNTGLSTVAEVVYFVRRGNLYRRQLLVREPLPTFTSSPQPNNPNLPGNTDLFDPASGSFAFPTADSFWFDFDYTAYFAPNQANSNYEAHFLGTDSLDNSGKALNVVAIANPLYRFGFSPSAIGALQGRPKEYTDSSTSASFIGRFTMQECSDPDFHYPQALTTNGNIPTNPAVSLTLDTFDSTVNGPDDFGQGTRRGEDLLLSNVHGFDVQVWDELAQSFVNIGDPALGTNSADYAPGNRYGAGIAIGTAPIPTYGPRVNEDTTINAINAVFDTWHPLANLSTSNDPSPSPNTSTAQTLADEPPYRATYYRPAAVSGGGGTFDKPSWQPNTSYNVGDVVFPSGPPGVTQAWAGGVGKLPYGAPFYYRCISSGTSTNIVQEPTWPKIDSVKIGEPGSTVVWQAVENRKPLKAIKIEVRFIDPSTQQMRQLTLIQSLVD
jgi:prepilin-type N-terminal cleavage/methylation domain-containing protein